MVNGRYKMTVTVPSNMTVGNLGRTGKASSFLFSSSITILLLLSISTPFSYLPPSRPSSSSYLPTSPTTAVRCYTSWRDTYLIMDDRGRKRNGHSPLQMTSLGALRGGGPTTLSEITSEILGLGGNQAARWRGR